MNVIVFGATGKTGNQICQQLDSKSLRGTLRSEGTRIILEAMKTTGTIATVHVVSAFGVGDSWGQMKWSSKLLTNLLLKSVMQDHDKQEQMVTNSSFQYHILRPVGLKDTDPKGSVHVQSEGFLPRNTISRADVAIYMVESMMKGHLGVSAIC